MTVLLVLAALLGACATPTAVDLPLDSDGDGLLDPDEVAAGTDPANVDSDADSYEDGTEVASYTDPTDPDDHPYAGGWPIDSCRNDIVGTGKNVGDVAWQFELVDQYDEVVRLHDFCNQAILIISGSVG